VRAAIHGCEPKRCQWKGDLEEVKMDDDGGEEDAAPLVPVRSRKRRAPQNSEQDDAVPDAAEETKTDSDSEVALQAVRSKRKKPVLDSDSEEELEVRAVQIVKESWINAKQGYPQRVFVVEMNTGPNEQIVAEDCDDPVEEPAEQNPFYLAVIQVWRLEHDVPARPQTKAQPKRRKKKKPT
jgi:hypothetical protein